MKRVILTVLVVAGNCMIAFSQTDAKTAASLMMRNLVDKYRTSSGLGFNVTYKYALAESPQTYIDTLNGQFKCLGDRYWFRLDNTETIRTPEYLIMLFGDDDIMYLAKPSANDMSNPMAMIDSLIMKRPEISCQVGETAQHNTIILNFSGNMSYKRIEYRIDKQTGYLTHMISTVRADHMKQPGSEQAAPSAIVEAVFSGYSQTAVDNTLFDAARYFRKEGNQYVTIAPFENYKVHLGSPGM